MPAPQVGEAAVRDPVARGAHAAAVELVEIGEELAPSA